MNGRVRDQINDLTNFTEERRYSALSGIVSIRGKADVSICYLGSCSFSQIALASASYGSSRWQFSNLNDSLQFIFPPV